MEDRLRLDAVRVKQGDLVFFLFKIDAKTLLKLATVRRRKDDPLTGIQRMLDKSRLKEIGEFIESGKAVFPNSLVVRLPSDTVYDDEKGTLEIPNRAESIFVIDGQHRLWSFDPQYSEKNVELPVSGFVDIGDPEAASIFVTINRTQRKINPSLVYDLFPMIRQTQALEFEDSRSQSLVESLYSDGTSPWHNQISMLGGREFLITQASFVSNVKQLFKKDVAFTWEGLQDEAVQKDLLFGFFGKVKVVFKAAWLSQDYILCKNTGVGALIRLMNRILVQVKAEQKEIADEKGVTLNYGIFEEYLRKIPERTFWREDVGQEYLGEAGIRRFYEKLANLAGLM